MMRTHNLMTLAQLSEKPRSKQEVFEGLEGSFDYAMPQGWLNEFSDWCKTHQFYWIQDVTYDLIRSTTVWHYKPERDSMGRPCTCSLEVAKAYLQFEIQHCGIKDVIYMLVNFFGWTLVHRDVVGFEKARIVRIGEQVWLQSPGHPELNLPLDEKDLELLNYVAGLVDELTA